MFRLFIKKYTKQTNKYMLGLQSKLDITYSRSRRAILNSSWEPHPTLDSSLIFLQSYAKAECNLRDTAGKQNENSRVFYCYGHLTKKQDELVSEQPPMLTSSVMI